MTVAEAYAEVERITRRRARNFAYGIMLLPKPKRQAIAAIYAFARQVDDVADGDLPDEEKRSALERLREGLGSPPQGAMWVALVRRLTHPPYSTSAVLAWLTSRRIRARWIAAAFISGHKKMRR